MAENEHVVNDPDTLRPTASVRVTTTQGANPEYEMVDIHASTTTEHATLYETTDVGNDSLPRPFERWQLPDVIKAASVAENEHVVNNHDTMDQTASVAAITANPQATVECASRNARVSTAADRKKSVDTGEVSQLDRGLHCPRITNTPIPRGMRAAIHNIRAAGYMPEDGEASTHENPDTTPNFGVQTEMKDLTITFPGLDSSSCVDDFVSVAPNTVALLSCTAGRDSQGQTCALLCSVCPPNVVKATKCC